MIEEPQPELDPVAAEIDQLLYHVKEQLRRQADSGTYLSFSNTDEHFYCCNFCVTYSNQVHTRLLQEVQALWGLRSPSRVATEPYVWHHTQYMTSATKIGAFFSFRYPHDPATATTPTPT